MMSRRWWAAGLAVALGLLLWMAGGSVLWLGSFMPARAQGAAKASSAVPVRVVHVRRQDVPLTLQAVGQVQSLQQVGVRPQVEGVLTEVRFKEGQRVTRGQVLARLDDRLWRAQLAQAQAELQRLRSQMALARLDLTRYEGLLAQSAVSTQQRDQQQALVTQLQAQIQAQDAVVTGVQIQLSYTTISSPVSGRVGLRQVDVGNVVKPSDALPLVTVVQTQPVAVVFAVSQSRLAEVRDALKMPGSGDVATVQVADQERGRVLAQGRLTTADNRVDPATGTLKLKAELPNTLESLWPGQFVAVTLRTGSLSQALVLPAQALQRGLKGTMVWRVRDAQAEMVPVQVPWQNDELAVVVPAGGSTGQPLSEGDTIVVDGQSRLKPKAAVKVLPDEQH